MKIVMTGGHHSSALPVIKKLKEKIPDIEILWMGHKYSMKKDKNPTLEYLEITSMGIPFFDLKAGKVYKTYDLGRLLKVPIGFFQAFFFLLKNRPDVILSFGGYLAAPVVIAGYILGIPSITHEQTIVAGYSNVLISRFAKKVMISWKESEKFFPKNKVVFTGLPLRDAIFEIKSDSFDINEKLPTIYISAGKTGSHLINETVGEVLKDLLSFCNIIHQCGDNSVYNDFEFLEKEYEKIKTLSEGKYFLRKFVLENEIGEAYGKANLVVSRSGAHTVSELIALKKPCLLIPIPWASHNEQFKNAKMAENSGLAEILEQENLNGDILLRKIRYCLSDLDRYRLKDDVFPEFLSSEPAELIAGEVIKLYEKSKKK